MLNPKTPMDYAVLHGITLSAAREAKRGKKWYCLTTVKDPSLSDTSAVRYASRRQLEVALQNPEVKGATIFTYRELPSGERHSLKIERRAA